MKKLLLCVATVLIAVIAAVTISTATALWVVKADGKNFYEIISDIELIARFGMAIITFAVLIIAYLRFIFYPLLYKIFQD